MRERYICVRGRGPERFEAGGEDLVVVGAWAVERWGGRLQLLISTNLIISSGYQGYLCSGYAGYQS